MVGLHSYILLVVVFLIGIFDSSVDGFTSSRIEKQLNGALELRITQKLDHFNTSDTREWQQRYFVNEDLFDTKGNVAFLFVSGETSGSNAWVLGGIMHLLGAFFNPILFELEHRYYGQSRPTEDTSTENLAYLSSEQALEDLAHFIQSMNKQYNLPSDVKWILFGGSYGGALATWMRLKYPNLVHGVMSSGAPVLAKLDYSEYLGRVQEAYRSHSGACVNAIQEGTRQLGNLLLNAEGQENINDMFRMCDDIDDNTDQLDISNLYQILAKEFGIAVENSDISMVNIMEACDFMTSTHAGEPEVRRLARFNAFVQDQKLRHCTDYKYEKMVARYKNTSWDSDEDRQWLYQSCTEFGFHITSNYQPQVFGDKFDLDFNIKRCQDVFGPQFDKTFQENAVKRTNQNYGGLDIKVDNVAYVYGSFDPAIALGVQEPTDKSPVIVIQGASREYMYDPMDYDTPQVVNARAQIKQFIASLLDQ